MILATVNHSFRYELEKLCRIFMPYEAIRFEEQIPSADEYILTHLQKGDKTTVLLSKVVIGGKEQTNSIEILNTTEDYTSECERNLAVMLYKCFVALTGYESAWGILTGVRPAKLYSKLTRNLGEPATADYFKNSLLVSDGKIGLCSTTFKSEEKITALSKPNSFSLYISIPFCPTRCSYCSFVSHSVEKAGKLVEEYLSLLKQELILTAKKAKENSLRLETIYIGGGTPTTLSDVQLEDLISCIKDNFDLSTLREFTVEAGRPDTVTAEKLGVLKNLGVDRISINPQTLNDEVLANIGRAHTVEQFFEAYKTAKQVGFKVINTDLIAGLPGDDFDSFKKTVDKIIQLDPENVTVHTLSLKRSSNMSANKLFPDKALGEEALKMVDYALKALKQAGIVPYYMYRQSKTVGNLENVGYAKEGTEGLYNIYIMDETHSVLACGASAVTKLREPNGPYIERIFNFKYPYEYISRFEEIIERKEGISHFYDKYNK
ncbi:MAG: coproporphyrinogen dehydrogenase HemZ [Clostridia bacterium]|nr:coproporphyrinogen dehydrogenase HemZ [Clostridia bacterium]